MDGFVTAAFVEILDVLNCDNNDIKNKLQCYNKIRRLFDTHFVTEQLVTTNTTIQTLFDHSITDLEVENVDAQYAVLLATAAFLKIQWTTPIMKSIPKILISLAYNENPAHIRSTALKCIRGILKEMILHTQPDILNFFGDVNSKTREMIFIQLEKVLLDLGTIESTAGRLYFFNVIVHEMFNTDNLELRLLLIKLSFNAVKIFKVMYLSDLEIIIFKKKITDSYRIKITKLQELKDQTWACLWQFLLKCMSNLLLDPSNISIMNSLLKNVENAFRGFINDKLLAFDCWKCLIDVYQNDVPKVTSVKQINLILTPLKRSLSKDDVYIEKRFDTFCHLMNVFQKNNVDVYLPEFLNFSFANFVEILPNEERNIISNVRKVPSLKLKGIQMLIEILGHYGHSASECELTKKESCVELEYPIVSALNYIQHRVIIKHAVLESTNIMADEFINTVFSKGIKCLWGSLISIINQLDSSQKETEMQELTSEILSFGKNNETSSKHHVFVLILELLTSNHIIGTSFLQHIFLFPLIEAVLKNEILFEKASKIQDLINSSINEETKSKWINEICTIFTKVPLVSIKFSTDIWLTFNTPLINLVTASLISDELVETFMLLPLSFIEEIQDSRRLNLLIKNWGQTFMQLCRNNEKYESVIRKLHDSSKALGALHKSTILFLPGLDCFFNNEENHISDNLINSFLLLLIDILNTPNIKSKDLTVCCKIVAVISNFYANQMDKLEDFSFKILCKCHEALCAAQVQNLVSINILFDKCSKERREILSQTLYKVVSEARSNADDDIAQLAITLTAKLNNATRREFLMKARIIKSTPDTFNTIKSPGTLDTSKIIKPTGVLSTPKIIKPTDASSTPKIIKHVNVPGTPKMHPGTSKVIKPIYVLGTPTIIKPPNALGIPKLSKLPTVLSTSKTMKLTSILRSPTIKPTAALGTPTISKFSAALGTPTITKPKTSISTITKPEVSQASPKILTLFGQSVEAKSHSMKESYSTNGNLPSGISKSTPKKVVKQITPIINDENSENFVPIISDDYVLQPDKLTDHQIEVLKKSRPDIPALYQDLSQSQSNTQVFFEKCQKATTSSDLLIDTENNISINGSEKDIEGGLTENKSGNDNKVLQTEFENLLHSTAFANVPSKSETENEKTKEEPKPKRKQKSNTNLDVAEDIDQGDSELKKKIKMEKELDKLKMDIVGGDQFTHNLNLDEKVRTRRSIDFGSHFKTRSWSQFEFGKRGRVSSGGETIIKPRTPNARSSLSNKRPKSSVDFSKKIKTNSDKHEKKIEGNTSAESLSLELDQIESALEEVTSEDTSSNGDKKQLTTHAVETTSGLVKKRRRKSSSKLTTKKKSKRSSANLDKSTDSSFDTTMDNYAKIDKLLAGVIHSASEQLTPEEMKLLPTEAVNSAQAVEVGGGLVKKGMKRTRSGRLSANLNQSTDSITASCDTSVDGYAVIDNLLAGVLTSTSEHVTPKDTKIKNPIVAEKKQLTEVVDSTKAVDEASGSLIKKGMKKTLTSVGVPKTRSGRSSANLNQSTDSITTSCDTSLDAYAEIDNLLAGVLTSTSEHVTRKDTQIENPIVAEKKQLLTEVVDSTKAVEASGSLVKKGMKKTSTSVGVPKTRSGRSSANLNQSTDSSTASCDTFVDGYAEIDNLLAGVLTSTSEHVTPKDTKIKYPIAVEKKQLLTEVVDSTQAVEASSSLVKKGMKKTSTSVGFPKTRSGRSSANLIESTNSPNASFDISLDDYTKIDNLLAEAIPTSLEDLTPKETKLDNPISTKKRLATETVDSTKAVNASGSLVKKRRTSSSISLSVPKTRSGRSSTNLIESTDSLNTSFDAYAQIDKLLEGVLTSASEPLTAEKPKIASSIIAEKERLLTEAVDSTQAVEASDRVVKKRKKSNSISLSVPKTRSGRSSANLNQSTDSLNASLDTSLDDYAKIDNLLSEAIPSASGHLTPDEAKIENPIVAEKKQLLTEVVDSTPAVETSGSLVKKGMKKTSTSVDVPKTRSRRSSAKLNQSTDLITASCGTSLDAYAEIDNLLAEAIPTPSEILKPEVTKMVSSEADNRTQAFEASDSLAKKRRKSSSNSLSVLKTRSGRSSTNLVESTNSPNASFDASFDAYAHVDNLLAAAIQTPSENLTPEETNVEAASQAFEASGSLAKKRRKSISYSLSVPKTRSGRSSTNLVESTNSPNASFDASFDAYAHVDNLLAAAIETPSENLTLEEANVEAATQAFEASGGLAKKQRKSISNSLSVPKTRSGRSSANLIEGTSSPNASFDAYSHVDNLLAAAIQTSSENLTPEETNVEAVNSAKVKSLIDDEQNPPSSESTQTVETGSVKRSREGTSISRNISNKIPIVAHIVKKNDSNIESSQSSQQEKFKTSSSRKPRKVPLTRVDGESPRNIPKDPNETDKKIKQAFTSKLSNNLTVTLVDQESNNSEDVIESSQETCIDITPLKSVAFVEEAATLKEPLVAEKLSNLEVNSCTSIFSDPVEEVVPSMPVSARSKGTTFPRLDVSPPIRNDNVESPDSPSPNEIGVGDLRFDSLNKLGNDDVEVKNLQSEIDIAKVNIDSPDELLRKDLTSNVIRNLNTAEMDTESVEDNRFLSPPSVGLPSSPQSSDTPSRTKELLDNTLNISPIKTLLQLDCNMEEKIQKAQQFFNSEMDSATSLEADAVPFNVGGKSSLKPKPSNSSRAAKCLNSIGYESPSINSSKIVKHKQTSKVYSLEKPSRVEKMLQNCENNAQKFVQNDSAKPPLLEKDILKFVRPLPGPTASPRHGILKRKALESGVEEPPSSPSKARRVNFPDPPTTCEKVFITDDSYDTMMKDKMDDSYDTMVQGKTDLYKSLFNESEVDAKRMALEAPQNSSNSMEILSLDTQGSVNVSDATLLNDDEPIFEPLVDCNDNIIKLLNHLTTPMFTDVLLKNLIEINIETIGDLAKLTEREVNRLPIKLPKVETVRKVLIDYKLLYDKLISVEPTENKEINNDDENDLIPLDMVEQEIPTELSIMPTTISSENEEEIRERTDEGSEVSDEELHKFLDRVRISRILLYTSNRVAKKEPH